VKPLACDQPVLSHGCVVTLWHHLPQRGPEPSTADLGRLLRRLHSLGPPPFPLPDFRPLGSVRRAIHTSQAIGDDERAWLSDHCQHLLRAYDQLAFEPPAGMIHGDAWRGNLLRDGNRVVLADWDAVSTGPREVDLVPTLQAARFGLASADRDAFIAAYGHDARNWPGYPVLRGIRELATLTALLRDTPADPAAKDELQARIRSLRTGDSCRWTTF
jgi:aminoglycoside phosphotransferase (APT) family kinase protein